MLSTLKEYLRTKKVASLWELSRHIAVDDPSMVRAMLQRWLDKGQVRCLPKTPLCGSRCQQCDPLLTEMYEWVT